MNKFHTLIDRGIQFQSNLRLNPSFILSKINTAPLGSFIIDSCCLLSYAECISV